MSTQHDDNTCADRSCVQCRMIRHAKRMLMGHPHSRRKGIGFNRRESDPVMWADLVTTRNDARTALSLALGALITDIHPATGCRITREVAP